MLSGREILKLIKKGELAVNPLDASIIRENGIDLRIGNEVAVLINNPNPLDPEKLGEVDLEEYFKVIKIEDSFVLQPYMKILVTTLEYIKMPINVGWSCRATKHVCKAWLINSSNSYRCWL